MEEEEEEEEEEEPEVEEPEEDPPKAELTDEEKKLWFFKKPLPDLTLAELSKNFTKFSMPEKDEGFDEVKTEWAKGSKAEEYIKNWILERKLTTRIEDIKPSDWFTVKFNQYQKAINDWQAKIIAWKAAIAKKAAAKAQKA